MMKVTPTKNQSQFYSQIEIYPRINSDGRLREQFERQISFFNAYR